MEAYRLSDLSEAPEGASTRAVSGTRRNTGALCPFITEMPLRGFELRRRRRDRRRLRIYVGIAGNSRQAGIDTAIDRRSRLRTRGPCGT
jgi:hypothetical protein